MTDYYISPTGDNFAVGDASNPLNSIKRVEQDLQDGDTIIVTDSSDTNPLQGYIRDRNLDNLTVKGVNSDQHMTLATSDDLQLANYNSFYFAKDGSEYGDWTSASSMSGFSAASGVLTRNNSDNEFGDYCLELVGNAKARRTLTSGRNQGKIRIRYKTDGVNAGYFRYQSTPGNDYRLQPADLSWGSTLGSFTLPATSSWTTLEIGPFTGPVVGSYRLDIGISTGTMYVQGIEFLSAPLWHNVGGIWESDIIDRPIVSPMWKGDDYTDLELVNPGTNSTTMGEGEFWSDNNKVYYKPLASEANPTEANLKLGDGTKHSFHFDGTGNTGLAANTLKVSGGQRGVSTEGSHVLVCDNLNVYCVGSVGYASYGTSHITASNFEIKHSLNPVSGMPSGTKGGGLIAAQDSTFIGDGIYIEDVIDDDAQNIGNADMYISNYHFKQTNPDQQSSLEPATESNSTATFSSINGKIERTSALTSNTYIIRDKGDVTSTSHYENTEIINNGSGTGGTFRIDNYDNRTTGAVVNINLCLKGNATGALGVQPAAIEYTICVDGDVPVSSLTAGEQAYLTAWNSGFPYASLDTDNLRGVNFRFEDGLPKYELLGNYINWDHILDNYNFKQTWSTYTKPAGRDFGTKRINDDGLISGNYIHTDYPEND